MILHLKVLNSIDLNASSHIDSKQTMKAIAVIQARMSLKDSQGTLFHSQVQPL